MSVNFEELGGKLEQNRITYPFDIMNNLSGYHDRTVALDSVMIDDLLLPGVFLFCPEADMDYFSIRNSIIEPDLQYRCLQLEYLSVIEIILLFDDDRQLALHLNPAAAKGKL